LIPNPIRKVLSSIEKRRVRALLMGGQACVFYGAAEFSRAARARPLLAHALDGPRAALEAGLQAEQDAEREADRAYWLPLKRELELLRHEAARKSREGGARQARHPGE
jgi:hypothetical protein